MAKTTAAERYETAAQREMNNEAALAAIARENLTRVPCRHCGVRCLPATLARHEGFCKPDEE